MAVFVSDSLPKYDGADLRGTVKRLHDYAIALSEQLRFLLANLDEDNVPALTVLHEQMGDAMGNLAELRLTAEGILGRVENAEGGLSTLQQTAEGLASRVENAEGGLSAVTQTADGLSARVRSAEGDLSTLRQTANGLTSRVESAEGNITSLRQTANGLSSTVSDLNGKYTSIRQTVDSIDVEGQVNHILDSGFARMDFVDGSRTVGSIISVDRDMVIGAERSLILNGSSVLFQSDTGFDCDVVFSGNVTVDRSGAFRVYLGSNRYWEFDTDGIHYHSGGSESVTMMKVL